MPEERGRSQSKAPASSSLVSPARRAAFEVLERVARTDAHSDDALHGPALAGLSQADRDLATTLVLGVLRWTIALDARLRPLLSRPEMDLPSPVAMALRLGAYQLLHLDRIPPHAALNESVKLARAAGHAHAAGMVNAVLRKLQSAPKPRKPLVETSAAFAERLGHPAWIVTRWIAAYGRAAAEAICAFDQEQPDCAALFADEDTPAPTMDPGSRLVAEIAAQSAPSAARVWDCCAAPGGKTVVLANRLRQSVLLATDASPARAKRLRARLSREASGADIAVRHADATTLSAEHGGFDLILCDVPCSGTGTLARNPEIRHRLQLDDLRRQSERQQRLLRSALARLAPGGRLIYSTCSLEPEENERVVEAVLMQSPGMQQLEVRDILNEMQAVGRLLAGKEEIGGWVRGPALRTLPGATFQGDGFYATVLARG